MGKGLAHQPSVNVRYEDRRVKTTLVPYLARISLFLVPTVRSQLKSLLIGVGIYWLSQKVPRQSQRCHIVSGNSGTGICSFTALLPTASLRPELPEPTAWPTAIPGSYSYQYGNSSRQSPFSHIVLAEDLE